MRLRRICLIAAKLLSHLMPPVRSTHNPVSERSDADPPPSAPFIRLGDGGKHPPQAHEWFVRVVGGTPLRLSHRVVALPGQSGGIRFYSRRRRQMHIMSPVRSTCNPVNKRSGVHPPPLAPSTSMGISHRQTYVKYPLPIPDVICYNTLC